MPAPSGLRAVNLRKAAPLGSTLPVPSGRGQGSNDLGGFMLNVRSRIGVVAVTSGAAVLLALPVVAAGQVPGVDQVVGGVTEAAGTVAPAPPAPLPAPAPPPTPAPQTASPAPAAPGTPAPTSPGAAAPTRSQGSAGSTRTPAHSSASASAVSGGERARARSAQQSGTENEGDVPPADKGSDERARASQDTGGGGADGTGAGDDPSSGTLPFTGLQLALILMVGLAALAGGAALRRGVRHSPS
jgi:hypothetical protein